MPKTSSAKKRKTSSPVQKDTDSMSHLPTISQDHIPASNPQIKHKTKTFQSNNDSSTVTKLKDNQTIKPPTTTQTSRTNFDHNTNVTQQNISRATKPSPNITSSNKKVTTHITSHHMNDNIDRRTRHAKNINFLSSIINNVSPSSPIASATKKKNTSNSSTNKIY